MTGYRILATTLFIIISEKNMAFMKRDTLRLLLLYISVALPLGNLHAQKELWPDGTPMAEWFGNTEKTDVKTLGRQYVITDYGVACDSTVVQTEKIQAVIELAAGNGGGVIVIPRGTYLSGALFFKQNTHLYVAEGGTLKGSDRIADFPILMTRIEGQTCEYFAALINADGMDGFTICGNGTIDGNGHHYWQEFWIRRQWNRDCTNKDAQRPRLTYLSNCTNATIQDVRLINSPFWTNHIYRCSHVRYLDCHIFAPTSGLKAPSSDAIDIDACTDVLISGCYMNVNDDAVVLKGGKGTFADKDSTNGPCERILIDRCHYGTVHGCLTLGSESVHDRNIIMRNSTADNANRVIWFKMRPDTPQHYEYVKVENFTGRTGSFLVIRPWTQFFKLDDRPDMPLSRCHDITLKNIRMECRNFFDVGTSDKYDISDFLFENIEVTDQKKAFSEQTIRNTTVRNVVIKDGGQI